MPLTIAEALKMEAFDKCRLLTGEAGQNNKIEWVNILEILDDLSHIEPGELLITTAHDFNTHSYRWQRAMIELFAVKKLAAVAIQTGHYVDKIPPSFIRFAEKHSIPLIEIPADVSFKSITRALMNRLIQDSTLDAPENKGAMAVGRVELLARSMKELWQQIFTSESPGDLHLDLNRFSLDMQLPIAVVIIYFAEEVEETNLQNGEQKNRLSSQAEPVVMRILRQLRVSYLVGPSENYLTILLQPSFIEEKHEAYIKNIIFRLIQELKVYFPLNKIQSTLSCLHDGLDTIKPALGEAEKALQAVRLGLVKNEAITAYHNLGLYRLIMDTRNMETLNCFYNGTIKPLLVYDNNCDGALIKTLRQYLDSCSIKRAAEILYVHRHTMKYRLEQVKKLTGLNPLLPEDALQLNIGLHIYRYLKALKML